MYLNNMILNGDEIIQYQKEGKIGITPWDEKKVGTNSYDVILSPKLKLYKRECLIKTPEDGFQLLGGNKAVYAALDPRKPNPTEDMEIPEKGFKLCAGQFVLGSTEEYCENNANDIVPMIEGRSSIARLGLSIHVTAGFGDVGFCGKWTLEIIAAVDIILYPYMPIGQLYWIRTTPTERRYKGKYQGQKQVTESRLNQESF